MPSYKPIPKEQMTPYQRWEMASFEEEPPPPEPEPEPVYVPPQLSEEQIAAIREQAHSEGYASGVQQGHAEGHAQGMRMAFEAGMDDNAHVLQQLKEIAGSFAEHAAASGEAVAPQLLDLALDLAKAMLKTALPVRPELMLPMVAAAVHALPGVQLPATLTLNPADAALVRGNLGEELASAGWRIAEDEWMERGGCRIDTANNQIDAGNADRWRRLAATLGKTDDWLA